MKERINFDGKCYKTMILKPGANHCKKCAFKTYRECEYSPRIPDCGADKRDDGNDVYFVEVKTIFDRITENPKVLAEQLVYSVYDEFYGCVWFGFTNDDMREVFKTKEEAIAATLEWLNKEVEK